MVDRPMANGLVANGLVADELMADGLVADELMAENRKQMDVVSNRTLTVKDIAQLSGVGVGTVSRVLNNHPNVSDETRQKVLKVIYKHGYVPNTSARNLKSTYSNTVAVLIKGIMNPFFFPIIAAIQHRLQELGYNFLLNSVNEQENEYDVGRALVIEKKLSGIIFMGGHLADSIYKLETLHCPYVLCTVDLSHDVETKLLNYVSVDDIAEGKRMTNYLLELGHRNLVYLATPKSLYSVSAMREQGFHDAVASSSYPLTAEVIRVDESDYYYSYSSGYEAMKKLLAVRRDFTAVFAASDTLAIGAMKAITDAGLRVPEDVSIAGFDGIDLCLFSNPTLTTMEQPAEKIASKTVEILHGLMGGEIEHGQQVFEGELRERKSTRKL